MRLICKYFYFLGAADGSVPISGIAVLAASSVTEVLGDTVSSPITPSVSVTAPSTASGVMSGVTFDVAVGMDVGTALSMSASAGVPAPQPHRERASMHVITI